MQNKNDKSSLIIFIIALVIDLSTLAIDLSTLAIDLSDFMFFLLALLAEPVELEDMARDRKAFFRSLLRIGIGHRADIDAFGMTAFGADQMMVMMGRIGKLIDIAGAAEDLVDDVELCQQGKVAVDRIERYVGLLLADFFTDLLGGRERRAGGKGLQDGAALWCYFIALVPQAVKGRLFFRHRLSPRLSCSAVCYYNVIVQILPSVK